MLDRFRQRSDPIAVEAAASALEIANAQTVVYQVRVSDIVKNYILSIIHAPSLIPMIKKRPTATTSVRATQTCPINLWRAVPLRNRWTIPPSKSAQRDRKVDCDQPTHGMRTSASTSADT